MTVGDGQSFSCHSLVSVLFSAPSYLNCGLSYPGDRVLKTAAFQLLPLTGFILCPLQWLSLLLPKCLQSHLIIMLITAQWKWLISEYMIRLMK